MDTLVQIPFTFCSQKVMFRAEQHTAQTLTAASYTQVHFDTITEDPYGGWDGTNFWWLCPAGCEGWYEVTLVASAANVATNTAQVQAVLFLTGTKYVTMSADWGCNGSSSLAAGSATVYLAGGSDNIAGYVFSTTGTTTSSTAGQYCTMQAVWVSS